jgi:YD repeat-containing protein
VRQTDARGQVTQFEHDRLGRLVRRLEADQDSRWIYDERYGDNSACANARGKLCEARTLTGTGAVDYSRRHVYDAQGRPTRSTVQAAVAGATGTYHSDTSYDAQGRVATRTYPGPEGQRLAIRHNHTPLGHLKSVSHATSGRVYWRADQTDEQGHLTQQTYANGVVTTRSWDVMGRLVSSAAGAGNAVHNDSYGHDLLGNLRRRTDTRAGVILTHDYDYDNLNRLKTEARRGGGVSGTQTLTWSYDAIDNRRLRLVLRVRPGDVFGLGRQPGLGRQDGTELGRHGYRLGRAWTDRQPDHRADRFRGQRGGGLGKDEARPRKGRAAARNRTP